MATSYDPMERSHENIKATRGVIAGGSVVAATAGVAAAVLAVLALVGMFPLLFAAIATICVGVAFLIEGSAVASRVRKMIAGPVTERQAGVIGGEMAMESLAGIAGIVLGVLALMDIQSLRLMCIAAIVYGCGVLLQSGAMARLNRVILSSSHLGEGSEEYAHEAVDATAGIDLLCGLAGIVLGILALIGYVPLTLVLVAMLTFGCVMLLTGSALTSRVLGALGH